MTKTCGFCGNPVRGYVTHKEISWPVWFRVNCHATGCAGDEVIHPIAPSSLAKETRKELGILL